MKKLILIFAFILLALPAFAANTCTTGQWNMVSAKVCATSTPATTTGGIAEALAYCTNQGWSDCPILLEVGYTANISACSSPIAFSQPGVTILGLPGNWLASSNKPGNITIDSSGCTGTVFDITADYFTMQDVTIQVTGSGNRSSASLFHAGSGTSVCNLIGVYVQGSASSTSNGDFLKMDTAGSGCNWITGGTIGSSIWHTLVTADNSSSGSSIASRQFRNIASVVPCTLACFYFNGNVADFTLTNINYEQQNYSFTSSLSGYTLYLTNSYVGSGVPSPSHFRFVTSTFTQKPTPGAVAAFLEYSDDVQFIGGLFGGQTRGAVIGAHASGTSISNMFISSGYYGGLDIQSGASYTYVGNNTFNNTCGVATNPVSNAITAESGATNFTLIGNMAYSEGGTYANGSNKFQPCNYMIYMAGSHDNAVVSLNNVASHDYVTSGYTYGAGNGSQVYTSNNN